MKESSCGRSADGSLTFTPECQLQLWWTLGKDPPCCFGLVWSLMRVVSGSGETSHSKLSYSRWLLHVHMLCLRKTQTADVSRSSWTFKAHSYLGIISRPAEIRQSSQGSESFLAGLLMETFVEQQWSQHNMQWRTNNEPTIKPWWNKDIFFCLFIFLLVLTAMKILLLGTERFAFKTSNLM